MKLRARVSGLGLAAMVSLALGCSPRAGSAKAPATPAPAGSPIVTTADDDAISSSSDEIPSTREAEDSVADADAAVGITTLTSTTLAPVARLSLPVALWEHWDEEPAPPQQTWGVSPSTEALVELWGY